MHGVEERTAKKQLWQQGLADRQGCDTARFTACHSNRRRMLLKTAVPGLGQGWRIHTYVAGEGPHACKQLRGLRGTLVTIGILD